MAEPSICSAVIWGKADAHTAAFVHAMNGQVRFLNDGCTDPVAFSPLSKEADIVFLTEPFCETEAAVSDSFHALFFDLTGRHIMDPDWAFGLPVLSPAHGKMVQRAKKICLPDPLSCGFLLPIFPLVASGLLPPDTGLTCTVTVPGEDCLQVPSPLNFAPVTFRSGLTAPPCLLQVSSSSGRMTSVTLPVSAGALTFPRTSGQLADFYRERFRNQNRIAIVSDCPSVSLSEQTEAPITLHIRAEGAWILLTSLLKADEAFTAEMVLRCMEEKGIG